MNKQIEEMSCKKCLHYEDCLKRYRNAKANGQYELIDEDEYFAHSDDCDMFITGYRKQSELAREIFEEIEKCFYEELVGCSEAKILDEEIFTELKKKYGMKE